MKKSRFLISSLAAAGIFPLSSAHAGDVEVSGFKRMGLDPDENAAVRKFAQEHRFTLAQHRSHSSHSSHRSHRSGASGTPRPPATAPRLPRVPRATPTPTPAPSTRNTRSNPPSSILPSSPATSPQPLLTPRGSGSSEGPSISQIEEVVRKVQAGLKAYGYYDGDLDAMVGPKTREALRRFQTDYGLQVTGTITPEVLDAFKIVAQ